MLTRGIKSSLCLEKESKYFSILLPVKQLRNSNFVSIIADYHNDVQVLVLRKKSKYFSILLSAKRLPKSRNGHNFINYLPHQNSSHYVQYQRFEVFIQRTGVVQYWSPVTHTLDKYSITRYINLSLIQLRFPINL